MHSTVRYFRFESLYTGAGWLTPACVGIGSAGEITYLSKEIPDGVAVEFVAGVGLPGFINAHSHAFQYAMAGRAEQHPEGLRDDFWTWREAMYQTALAVDPDQMQAIATMLYIDMLKNGYTHVAEFHYLHHDKNGKPYAHLAEMGERLLAAAATAGIRITLIPVFYQQANFGVALHPRQRRFLSATTDEYLTLWAASEKIVNRFTNSNLAASVHSLRAVASDALLETVQAVPGVYPFHLHVAEQTKEVEDCVRHYGQRPMEWLLNQGVLNERFFLVHSTHLNDQELQQLAPTQATVVLCPSTEGNLGDGFFRMTEHLQNQGRWCIGTDSHVGLSPLEELRMIDYRQRLLLRQRNPLGASPAEQLIGASIFNGLRSVGRAASFFNLGDPLDVAVYTTTDPRLAGSDDRTRLSVLLYTHTQPPVATLVGGQWVVHQHQHPLQASAQAAFAKVVHEIF